MKDLERRYTRLVRLWYPSEYRRTRGTELVGTYLELAAPEQRRPSVADAVDLAVGGTRQRLRATEVTGLGPGFRLAAVLALLTASAFAGGWTVLELRPPPEVYGVPTLGRFASLGIAVWVAWLLAATVHLVAPGRWSRGAIGIALLGTVAVVPLAALTGQPRPPLLVLLPQAALGIVALGAPARFRLLPAGAAAAGAYAGFVFLPRGDFFASYYGYSAGQALAGAAIGLLIVVTLLGLGLAARGDHRGGWALLVLAGPIGMLALNPLAGALDGGLNGAPNATWPSLAVVAVTVGVAGPASVPLALAALRRLRRGPSHRAPLR
jgi:hypothetical protein